MNKLWQSFFVVHPNSCTLRTFHRIYYTARKEFGILLEKPTSTFTWTRLSHKEWTWHTCLWKRIIFYLQCFSSELQYKAFVGSDSTDRRTHSELEEAGCKSVCVCVNVCMCVSLCMAALTDWKSLDEHFPVPSPPLLLLLQHAVQWLSPFFPPTCREKILIKMNPSHVQHTQTLVFVFSEHYT